jgi:hypothetical protein
MSRKKLSILAWAVFALLTVSAGALVLSHDPVVAGGGESGSGESGSGESGSGESGNGQ